jgi:hypothetical protein
LWEGHHGAWRDPAQIAGLWGDAASVDGSLLAARASRSWWDLLDHEGICLLVTREYEHLVLALSVVDGRPHTSFLPIPHPSGLAVDRSSGLVHLASTRNPNVVVELAPAADAVKRLDASAPDVSDRPLVPVRASFYPGATYLHDLAFVDGRLHGNAVGSNAVVRLEEGGHARPVWWPRCIERNGWPELRVNLIQLNSIAAGADLESSFFTASTDTPGRRRPGHLDFRVDRCGVVFSGATGDVV